MSIPRRKRAAPRPAKDWETTLEELTERVAAILVQTQQTIRKWDAQRERLCALRAREDHGSH